MRSRSKISLKKTNNQAQPVIAELRKAIVAIIDQDAPKASAALDNIPDKTDYEWSNLLSIAIFTQNREMVETIFTKSPTLNIQSYFALLSEAAQQNDPALFEIVFAECKRNNIDINIADLFLIRAGAEGDLEKFQAELQRCIANKTEIRWQLVLNASAGNAQLEIFDFALAQTSADDALILTDIVASAAQSGNMEILKKTLEVFRKIFPQDIDWQSILISAAKSGNIDMFYYILYLRDNFDSEKVSALDWVTIFEMALNNKNQPMIEAIFEMIPDKLDILRGALATNSPRKIIDIFNRFIERFDSIFGEIVADKKTEFIQNFSLIISKIPQHIDNLKIFKILQDFSITIKDQPEIDNLEITIDSDRHDSIHSLSALYRTNKTFRILISKMVGSEAPPSTIAPASALQLDTLPEDILTHIVGFVGR